MIPRLLKLPLDQNILLFGPRGTGKSTLLRTIFPKETTYWIDLLDAESEQHFAAHPQELKAVVDALGENITHVVIDEIQKIPRLLDVVHSLIESTSKLFVLTGSSARKLKRGGANLLAGRAFVYHLFPLTFMEMKDNFDLLKALQFGQQPMLLKLRHETDIRRYLASYTNTYLKEEIAAEQVVKNLLPFRRFLEVAAQSNGKIINYHKIALNVGVSDVTVKEYFSILEDTLIGFLLEPFHTSFRKRLSQKPKFYFFDTGVARALSRLLSVPLAPKTSPYGDAFEHLVILEATRLASYFCPEYRFSYIHTKDNAEIDLLVERPGLSLLCIEIKSSDYIKEEDISSFARLSKDLPDCEAVCLSNDPTAKRYGQVIVLPWQQGLKKLFTSQASS
ncbi:MAG TPA: ATP-binding protein [Myxococcota bacterium]|nr:ATP-binding protein [Myxococcota bacterium]